MRAMPDGGNPLKADAKAGIRIPDPPDDAVKAQLAEII
jgi:hypothetical protein